MKCRSKRKYRQQDKCGSDNKNRENGLLEDLGLNEQQEGAREMKKTDLEHMT